MYETLERIGLSLSLRSPWFFQRFVRPELYRRMRVNGETDPEDVHLAAMEMASKYCSVFEANRELFNFPELKVRIKNLHMQPFGTAAGMDKNGDALVPFSYVFGFQTLGTVLVDRREGNDRPRVAVDNNVQNVYNAQGFPSEGLKYVLIRLRAYRLFGAPQKPVIASVCGLPHVIREEGAASFVPNKDRVVTDRSSPMLNRVVYKEFADFSECETEQALENAFADMHTLLVELNPYVDGFEWNPFSPNTKTLTLLRNPATFKRYANLVREVAPEKLAQVKMGPYDSQQKDAWLRLVEGWLKGGDGVTAVNTYLVPKEQVPSGRWGYSSAGKSGRFLAPYRNRAIEDARDAFPEAVIFATGGIDSSDEAYLSFDLGADAVEGYTPFTYKGLGLQRRLMNGVLRELERSSNTLQQFIDIGHEDARLMQSVY